MTDMFDIINNAQAKDTEFASLSPAQKKERVQKLIKLANSYRNDAYVNSERRGQTQGYAFLWVNVYGKSKLASAFKRELKKSSEKVFTNYRGAKFAWYFGSQCDVGIYDSLQGMTKFLSDQGIECFVEDEWD